MSIIHDPRFIRGFGTYTLRGETLEDAVATAVDVGYRAFDTAQWYENEGELGNILKNLSVKKEEFLITTKVHPENISEERFIPSVEQSIKDLGRDTLDVLLLHWPVNSLPLSQQFEFLQKAKELGYARHVGVSNFTANMMRKAQKHLNLNVIVNQVEFHPLLNQSKLLKASHDTGIGLSSYCSLARGRVFSHPIFGTIGMRYEKSAAQVVLRWIIQQNIPINTSSAKRKNIQDNFDILDFELSDEEIMTINQLRDKNIRLCDADDIPYAPVWD